MPKTTKSKRLRQNTKKSLPVLSERLFLSVGVAGFEPTTPCSQSRCANRTALHPVVPDPETSDWPSRRPRRAASCQSRALPAGGTFPVPGCKDNGFFPFRKLFPRKAAAVRLCHFGGGRAAGCISCNPGGDIRRSSPRRGYVLSHRGSFSACRNFSRTCRNFPGNEMTKKKEPPNNWRFLFVGETGFEPATSNSRSWRANRTALHPELF